ncbi:hypothetical protein BpHYR1_049338 [Brachionus plicatilis]|uniref:Uncharacterized protein n=1 Tax=Brachionus plicatilis TaxID=10195 RepID=A0A3M7SF32_BRAPC|nr:hypothetical protein BpHYR1_049338 [Brachionus plicatilis]
MSILMKVTIKYSIVRLNLKKKLKLFENSMGSKSLSDSMLYKYRLNFELFFYIYSLLESSRFKIRKFIISKYKPLWFLAKKISGIQLQLAFVKLWVYGSSLSVKLVSRGSNFEKAFFKDWNQK